MKTNVYIDGFNVYYAFYKNWDDPACHDFKMNGPYKWVDFRALAAAIFPSDTIHRIQYCTAMVKGARKAARQEVYLRALRGMPLRHVRLGHFEEREKHGPLRDPLPCQVTPPCLGARAIVGINAREEKGSDVNLATYLLKDAFLGDCEQAVVISNDSDLASAIHVARVDARLPVHVVSPSLQIVRELRSAATSVRLLDKSLIPMCQLPSPITPSDGTVLTKPVGW